MAKILYCWELGADLGHISSFVPLAQELLSRGHEVVMILREVQRARGIIGSSAIPVLSAPVWSFAPVVAPKPTGTYSDILFHFGYLDPSGLSGMIAAWQELYRLVGPQLILADHAPTALLAARCANVKALTYGSGFFTPPAETPLPGMQPGPFAAPMSRVLSAEEKVLKAVNSALGLRSAPRLRSLADLFPAQDSVLLTYEELDHYPDRKGGEYFGVVANAAGTTIPEWPKGTGMKVFGYLKIGYPHFERVLASLTALGCSTVVFAGGIPERDRISHSNSRVEISKHALDIHRAMQECDLAVCHAGIGTVVPALLAGKPLFLLPMQGEQSLMAARVTALGAGLAVPMMPAVPDYLVPLRRLLSEPGFAAGAQKFADRNQSPARAELIASLADRCERELAMQPH